MAGTCRNYVALLNTKIKKYPVILNDGIWFQEGSTELCLKNFMSHVHRPLEFLPGIPQGAELLNECCWSGDELKKFKTTPLTNLPFPVNKEKTVIFLST